MTRNNIERHSCVGVPVDQDQPDQRVPHPAGHRLLPLRRDAREGHARAPTPPHLG